MLGGCETFKNLIGMSPAEIAPSTFCQSYEPITSPFARGTPEADAWWDAMPEKVGAINDARIRGNNEAYTVTCGGVE